MAPPRRRVGDLGFHGRRRRRFTALLRRNFFFGLLVIPTDSGSKMKQSGEPIHASHFTTPNLWIVTMQTKIPSVSYFHICSNFRCFRRNKVIYPTYILQKPKYSYSYRFSSIHMLDECIVVQFKFLIY
jgi:hypothetical protein